MVGSVISIFVSPEAGAPMRAVSEAVLEVSRGIVGDRYFLGVGTFSKKLSGSPDSEVTLIESEQVDQFNLLEGLKLDYGSLRRNIVTRGIKLNELVGVRFRVGESVLEGLRLCEPCAHLATLVSEKVLPGLVHRSELRARIVSGGSVRPEDGVGAV
jgi:MOSC domain-containing protein YiiM